MKFYLNPTNNEVFAYDPDEQQDLIDLAIENGWSDVSDKWPPRPTSDQLATAARAQRDTLLTASDWTQLPDAQASLSPEKKAAWSAYRQALRDITGQATFPQEITWPDKP
jgi:hypothetical protein